MFPFDRLQRAKAAEWVLDPFCGRGTTIYAARLRGLGSVGLDSNPVAAAIAAAKLVSARAEEVAALAREIVGSTPESEDVPAGDFWRLCYDRSTLVEICKLRARLLRQCSTDDEIALRAIILGILHGPRQKGPPTYLSNQMPRTYATKPSAAVRFWNRRRMRARHVDVVAAIERRARFVLEELPPPAPGQVFFADSRTAKLARPEGKGFAWVITSPPYFGMRTYRPDQWLRNWFLGGEAGVNYTQEGQLAHQVDRFTSELARVWANIAGACAPGARLVVRFGALPSVPIDARTILKTSLVEARCGWRAVTVRPAGLATNGKRQSDQFGRQSGTPIEEIDLFAVLEK
jgi:hypothetical protein